MVKDIVIEKIKEKENKINSISADKKIDCITIFPIDESEYIILDEELKNMGELIDEMKSGNLYRVKDTIKTVYGDLEFLKVRKYDKEYAKYRISIDFVVNDYNRYKENLINPVIKRYDNFELIQHKDEENIVNVVSISAKDEYEFNILITSGGFNDINNYVSDSNRKLFKRISKGKKVLILANAAPKGTGNYIARENVKENFLNAGAIITDILDIDNSNIENILKYDIVYGLGGNPTHLIELNKTTNLKEVLIKFLEKGIYIGESAGSMILSDDLKYAYTIKKGTKPKYDIKLDTYKGLNLVQYKIFPHYNKVNEEMEGKIKSYELNNNEKITRLNDGEIIKIRYTINCKR